MMQYKNNYKLNQMYKRTEKIILPMVGYQLQFSLYLFWLILSIPLTSNLMKQFLMARQQSQYLAYISSTSQITQFIKNWTKTKFKATKETKAHGPWPMSKYSLLNFFSIYFYILQIGSDTKVLNVKWPLQTSSTSINQPSPWTRQCHQLNHFQARHQVLLTIHNSIYTFKLYAYIYFII